MHNYVTCKSVLVECIGQNRGRNVQQGGAGSRPSVASYPIVDIDINKIITLHNIFTTDAITRRNAHLISVYNMYTKFKNIEFSLISYRITIQIFE